MENENPQPENVNPDPQGEEPQKTVTEEKGKEIHHHHYYYGREKRRGANNFGQLFFGLIILFFGIAYLARSLGLVQFDLNNWLRFWPVLIIVAGLSLISFRGWLGGIIGIILILILALIVIFLAVMPINYSQFGSIGMMGGIDSQDQNYQTEPIVIARDKGTLKAVINVKTGAGDLNIGGKTTDLLSGSFSSNFLTLNKSSILQGDSQTVDIETAGSWPIMMGRGFNQLNLQLNNDLPLDLNLVTGATAMKIDLRDNKVNNLSVDTGASGLELYMGDKADSAEVTIKAGASSIKIALPSYVGAKVEIDSGLSSKNFTDFDKIDDHNYRSKNYDLVSKKIDFNFSVGASSVEINWE